MRCRISGISKLGTPPGERSASSDCTPCYGHVRRTHENPNFITGAQPNPVPTTTSLSPASLSPHVRAKSCPNKVEEERIVDPDATQPEDWDEEEDGEWEAPVGQKDLMPLCSSKFGAEALNFDEIRINEKRSKNDKTMPNLFMPMTFLCPNLSKITIFFALQLWVCVLASSAKLENSYQIVTFLSIDYRES
jgi:hypothetical protein